MGRRVLSFEIRRRGLWQNFTYVSAERTSSVFRDREAMQGEASSQHSKGGRQLTPLTSQQDNLNKYKL
jgi:hypothetical protein